MANVFGILTAIVLALSAFIAYKNKNAYQAEVGNAASEAASLVRSQQRLETAQNRSNDLSEQIPVVENSIAELTKQEAELKTTSDTLTAQREEKSQTIASNKEKLDEIRRKTAEVGEVKELAGRMRATNVELEELQQSISTAEVTLASVTAENKEAEAIVASRKAEFETFSRGESLPGLETRISSIYPTWGFVTLASGNNAGVIANSTLDVVRNGEVIAKLLVTAVEDSTASASIIPDSMSEDVTLMVGDRVVPGRRDAQPSAARN
jgi:predicted RNase H-like nuclease (RuvC/YqgF family)